MRMTVVANGYRPTFASQNKNTHLNQAIHEEQEAILELRVQLRLLQSHKLQHELAAPPPPPPPPLPTPAAAEQAAPTQPSPEARGGGEEQVKVADSSASTPATACVVAPTGKTVKDPPKPSPSKDRRDGNM